MSATFDLQGDGNIPATPATNYIRMYTSDGTDLNVITDAGITTDLLKSGRLQVANASGATANENDVGYIDESGDYQTTTTEGDDVAWCVVVSGGANGSTIAVQTRGNATISYAGTAPNAGDYLITSTTAGSALASSQPRSAMFAVCTAAGSGGTVEALLLTQTQFVAASDSNNVIDLLSHSDTAFESTVSGTPTSTSVTYGTVTTGAEDTIDISSSSELGKVRLYNSTRGTYRLIESVDTATNTITTVASTDSWASGDAITAESQTVTLTGSAVFFEIDLSQQTVIPVLARSVSLHLSKRDTGGADERLQIHPVETYAGGKVQQIAVQVAGVFTITPGVPVALNNRTFAFSSTASGTGTGRSILKVTGYYLATP
jgi:hypothetical protein